MYLVFGVLTTLVNIITYYVLYNFCRVGNVLSTTWAQVLSILFAYITNKLWVFNSKSWKFSLICYEIISFFGFRAVSALFDIGFMWVTVSLMNIWPLGMKITSNVIVVIMNYLASKLMIFKKR
jgi:putative flippase GtrA